MTDIHGGSSVIKQRDDAGSDQGGSSGSAETCFENKSKNMS